MGTNKFIDCIVTVYCFTAIQIEMEENLSKRDTHGGL
jgi:hypothetical protein